MINKEIILLLLCMYGSYLCMVAANIVVNIDRKNMKSECIIKAFFCNGCPSPEAEGSIAFGLLPKYAIKDKYSVTGQVVYAVPNFAEREEGFLNVDDMSNRIVMVDRGIVSLYQKVLRIQQQSSAVGVIIADDGKCDESFSFCGYRIGSAPEGGFSAFDDESLWHKITIPVILIGSSTADKMRSLMNNVLEEIPFLGTHNVTVVNTDYFYDEL